MGSKRRRAPPSSSSSSYDKHRFASKEAFERYTTKWGKKKLLGERGMSGIFEETIAAHGWQKLVKQTEKAVVPLVREFYANAFEMKNYTVHVRGKLVSCHPSAINRYYNITRTRDDECRSMLDGDVDQDHIIQAIAYPGSEWKEGGRQLSYGSLLHESRAWHLFIAATLLPTSNLSEVTKERAILNYAIHLRTPINVGWLIYGRLQHVLHEAKTTNLPYPCLITQLCIQAGVEIGRDEETYSPIEDINANTVARFDIPDRAHHMEYEVEPNVRAILPASRSAPEAPELADVKSQLRDIKQSLHDVQEHQRRSMEASQAFYAQYYDFQQYQVQCNNALAAALSLHPGTTFPNPPPSFAPASSSAPPPNDDGGA